MSNTQDSKKRMMEKIARSIGVNSPVEKTAAKIPANWSEFSKVTGGAFPLVEKFIPQMQNRGLAEGARAIQGEGLGKLESDIANAFHSRIKNLEAPGTLADIGNVDRAALQKSVGTGAVLGGSAGAVAPTDEEVDNPIFGPRTRKGGIMDRLRNVAVGAAAGGSVGALNKLRNIPGTSALLENLKGKKNLSLADIDQAMPFLKQTGELDNVMRGIEGIVGSGVSQNGKYAPFIGAGGYLPKDMASKGIGNIKRKIQADIGQFGPTGTRFNNSLEDAAYWDSWGNTGILGKIRSWLPGDRRDPKVLNRMRMAEMLTDPNFAPIISKELGASGVSSLEDAYKVLDKLVGKKQTNIGANSDVLEELMKVQQALGMENIANKQLRSYNRQPLTNMIPAFRRDKLNDMVNELNRSNPDLFETMSDGMHFSPAVKKIMDEAAAADVAFTRP